MENVEVVREEDEVAIGDLAALEVLPTLKALDLQVFFVDYRVRLSVIWRLIKLKVCIVQKLSFQLLNLRFLRH